MSAATAGRLQNIDGGDHGTDEAEACTERTSGTGALGWGAGGGASRWNGAASGRGLERAGDRHALGGVDDAGVGDGVAGGGDGVRRSDGSVDGGAVGGRLGGLVAGDGRAGSRVAVAVVRSSRGGGGNGSLVVGDTELGGVLVLAGRIIDELNSVAVGVHGGGQVGRRSPGELAAVGNTLNDVGELHGIGGRALEEDEGHGAGGGRVPGDLEGLASGNNLVQRTSNGVADRLSASGLMLLSDREASEQSNEGELSKHLD